MNAELKQAIEKIAKLTEKDVGPQEENVKLKIVVPLLELLGHKRENLQFEYSTQGGGRIDIFIKNVPRDCKVLIDTKSYNERLDDHIDQIKKYTSDEGALLAIIANGSEIRIYSLFRGVAFEKSLLYSIKREDIVKESVWATLTDILQIESLKNRTVHKKIDERERQIKDVMAQEENVMHEYENKTEGIDIDIQTKNEEIERLIKEKENLEKEAENKISDIWANIDLPREQFAIMSTFQPYPRGIIPLGEHREYNGKAGNVTFQEIVDAGLIKDGQTLYFYNTRLFQDEQTQIMASSNKLKYKRDGKIYSSSELAKVLLIRHGFKRDDHGVAGPKYWRTEDGKLLHDINEQVRAKRGDRK